MAVQKLRRLLAGVQSRLSACKYRPAKQLRERGSKLKTYNHTSQSYTHTHTHTHHPHRRPRGRALSVPAPTRCLGTNRPRDARGREPGRAGGAPEGAGTSRDSGAGRPWPCLSPQPAVPTRHHAAEPAPAIAERANWVPRPSGPARPDPAAPLRFPPLRPARGVLALLHDPGGHISLRRDSSLPALVPRRQAGACSRGRTPSETHTAPGRWLAPGRIPGWGASRRVGEAKPPRPSGWHKSAGGRAGGIGRRHLPRGVGLALGAADSQPGVPARAQGWRLQPRSVGSPAALLFAISLSFSPSWANSSLQKTFSLRFGPTSLLPSDSARRGRAKAAGAAVSERKTQKWLLA
ncbi:translation initiation factor IF-2-like [Leopardus geoffroyi]|uniref:translation initiation factor IF-2-like n=1 Tax=Leopardus geoffroyi TaxID=46844 RepID=UPI001E2613AE|nr:translation initiation factor IF-2-like [Leopardus geoffroyi]